MSTEPAARAGEYADRGDYHLRLDPHWSYAPIYERKVRWLDKSLELVPKDWSLLDVGAGEGAIVARCREQGRTIEGVDGFYASELVRKADLRELPYEDGSFDAALCLDVLEHVPLLDQPVAVAEIARVLKPGGTLLMTVPNLAHLHSRIRFLLAGKLTRTSAVERHPGDRPLAEYREMLEHAGFVLERVGGIFPTLPLAFRLVNHQPARFGWLVGALDSCVPFVSWRFLATIRARKK